MKLYKYLFVWFLIFGILFGPNFYIFGISLRVITSSMGLLLLFTNWHYCRFDKAFYFYIVYIIYYIFISIVNGQINDSYFIPLMLNWHLPCLLLYLLIPSFLRNSNEILRVCYILIGLLVFDVIISIGQFANITLAWDIGNTLNAYAAENIELYMERNDVTSGYIGLSIINGICASVVDNGYIIATFFPMAFVLNDLKRVKSGFLFFFIVFLCVIASFAIQQRMGFYLIVLMLVFYFWSKTNALGRVFLLLGGSLALVVPTGVLDNLNLGRVSEFEDEDRLVTYTKSILTIFSDNRLFWIGGESYYRQFFEHTPHNTLIGAWVYSGFVGFLLFLFLLIVIFKRVIPSFIGKKSQNDVIKYSLAAGCLIFIAYSMTHSTGIHNGKALYFWLLYGLYNKYDYIHDCLLKNRLS